MVRSFYTQTLEVATQIATGEEILTTKRYPAW